MEIVRKFNKGIHFLLCAIDISSRYSSVILLKNKEGITITNAFLKISDESNLKPNKIFLIKAVNFTIDQ